jgi:hypothetical protein
MVKILYFNPLEDIPIIINKNINSKSFLNILIHINQHSIFINPFYSIIFDSPKSLKFNKCLSKLGIYRYGRAWLIKYDMNTIIDIDLDIYIILHDLISNNEFKKYIDLIYNPLDK